MRGREHPRNQGEERELPLENRATAGERRISVNYDVVDHHLKPITTVALWRLQKRAEFRLNEESQLAKCSV